MADPIHDGDVRELIEKAGLNLGVVVTKNENKAIRDIWDVFKTFEEQKKKRKF